jgi:phage-related protein
MRGHSGKEIRWWGSSYKDLLAFPSGARRTAGYELSRVQAGLDPEDWKPFDDVGAGTREIRLRDDGPDGKGIYRVMYVAKFPEAVHVLHCFAKTTQATSQHDKRIVSERYKAMAAARG